MTLKKLKNLKTHPQVGRAEDSKSRGKKSSLKMSSKIPAIRLKLTNNSKKEDDSQETQKSENASTSWSGRRLKKQRIEDSSSSSSSSSSSEDEEQALSENEDEVLHDSENSEGEEDVDEEISNEGDGSSSSEVEDSESEGESDSESEEEERKSKRSKRNEEETDESASFVPKSGRLAARQRAIRVQNGDEMGGEMGAEEELLSLPLNPIRKTNRSAEENEAFMEAKRQRRKKYSQNALEEEKKLAVDKLLNKKVTKRSKKGSKVEEAPPEMVQVEEPSGEMVMKPKETMIKYLSNSTGSFLSIPPNMKLSLLTVKTQ
eukprot:TRINITY_DN6971_c0_g1_i1.p1 TRINITY_DN6971_c0_g1~~TRINITY_DN6971_c0_g1_i1.p1  ORF type:complete len:317 (+),score=122.98 TRINITY_DN6971_c0_g1_i1:101-1051(+)